MGAPQDVCVMCCPMYYSQQRTPACVAVLMASHGLIRVYVDGAFDGYRYTLRLQETDIPLVNTGGSLEGRAPACAPRPLHRTRTVMLLGWQPRELLMVGASTFI